uniref:Uncharacterized protein n=2 Tax=Tetraodon nigroviridis TaxID=99883 RepID=H3C1X9_TETNG
MLAGGGAEAEESPEKQLKRLQTSPPRPGGARTCAGRTQLEAHVSEWQERPPEAPGHRLSSTRLKDGGGQVMGRQERGPGQRRTIQASED